MKLRRLKIDKFRNIQPGTELEFNDGYNVLLGQNGTGKTTLLRLISSVLRGDFEWLADVEFALEAELEGDSNRLAFKIRHERKANEEKPFATVPAELRAYLPTKEAWSNSVISSFSAGTQAWEVRQENDRVTMAGTGVARPKVREDEWISWAKIHLFSGMYVYRNLLLDDKDTRQLSLCISEINELIEAFRFDESLEVFACITSRGSALGKPEYAHLDGQLRVTQFAPQLPVGALGSLIPREIREQNSSENPNFNSPSDTIVIKHDQAEFLAKVTPMLGYVGSELKLDLLGKEVTEEQQKLEYGNLRFFFHKRDGSIVNQDYLSYGQKRLLTFFYYLACNPHVVVADELVNGLHHAWIAECIQAMGDRQVFVTSQNPVLLDHLSFDSAEQVRRTFITCQAKPEGAKDRITWANMTKKNADSFYRAYKVGAQHVGEILRTKGFW
jgi:energy-coupling factor transporter ATP-binding protein EcfA2